MVKWMLPLLAVLTASQAAQSPGIVTGVVRSPNGQPATAVRVFAIAARAAGDPAIEPTVLEVFALTDASGRYRLEIPAGRYYIAAGSVDQPTYYPNTTIRTDGQPIGIVSGVVLEGIDFSSYVAPAPAARDFFSTSFVSPTPASVVTVPLSGLIRHGDGAPVRGIEVIAVPSPRNNSAVTPRNIPQAAVVRTQTDSSGRFRLSVLPGNYYLVSGSPSVFTIYPGTPDIANAKAVAVNAQGTDNLNFTAPGNSMSGRVLTADRLPAIGAVVDVRLEPAAGKPVNVSSVGDFLKAKASWQTLVESDGSFSVYGLPLGRYTVRASEDSGSVRSKEAVVEAQSLTNSIDISLPIALMAGTIALPDGRPVPDPSALGSVVISSTNPEDLTSALFNVSRAGTFGGILGPGEYRITLPSLPRDFTLIAITAAGRDLITDSFRMTESESVRIEVRVELSR
jgi:hypothetical protein